MRLRTFLIRRGLHTIITLVVILVLLFVIFRLMPGNPTRFFIEPGQTKETTDRLKVQFGFSKWVRAPGVYREAAFGAHDVGIYIIQLDISDEKGNNITLFSSYVKEKEFFVADPIAMENITFYPRPDGNISVGDQVNFSVEVRSESPDREVRITVGHEGENITTEDLPLITAISNKRGLYGTTLPSNCTEDVGIYEIEIFVLDPKDNRTETAPSAYVVNPADISPFELVDKEGRLFTYPDKEVRGVARVRVAVKSSEGKILDEMVGGKVVGPSGKVQIIDDELIHPDIVVDRTWWEQFWVYFFNMIRGDFGNSFFSKRPVWTEIAQRAPATILLFGSALALSALLGIGIGAVLAWRRGSVLEMSSIVASLFFYSMPLFWFGLILLWAFGFKLRLFPLGGIGGIDANGVPLTGLSYVADILWHMVLPLVTLMIVNLAGYILLMRNSMLEVLGEDYITTARAKGLSERTVMYKHAARNAMLPVTTVIAIGVGTIISGGVLTETIFSWPGMGYFLVTSTIQQDYPAVQGTFFLLAVMTVLANVGADILYAFLDPRVRL